MKMMAQLGGGSDGTSLKIQRIVRRGNIGIGAIILLSAMILSWNHTADLFEWAFYSGWLAQIGVLMVEFTFFLGALNIILARAAGMKAGWPARVTFLFGSLLVGWSNVSSGRMLLSREDTAVALGLSIPICLFLMEAIVSRALFQFRDRILSGKKKEGTLEVDQVVKENSSDVEDSIDPASVAVEKEEKGEETAEENVLNVQEMEKGETDVPVTEEEVSPTVSDQAEIPAMKAEEQSLTPTEEDRQEREEKKEEQSKNDTPANLSEKRMEKEDVLEVALNIWEKECEGGPLIEEKRPGRKRIVKETGCTDHMAKIVVKELKKKAS